MKTLLLFRTLLRRRNVLFLMKTYCVIADVWINKNSIEDVFHFTSLCPAVQNTNAMCTICNLEQSGRVQQGTKFYPAPSKEKEKKKLPE